MRKKLSLLLAAAMLAVTFQTAMAADDMDDEIDQQIEDAADSGSREGRLDRRMGAGGRWGYGPAMPGKPGGPGMMHEDYGSRRDLPRGPGGSDYDFDFVRMRMMEQFNLTADQKQQVVNVMTENFRERMQARIDLGDAIKKLRDIHKSSTPDHGEIIIASEAVGSAYGKLDVLGHKLEDGIKAILTPEQKEKLEDIIKERGGFHNCEGFFAPPHVYSGPGPQFAN